MKTLVVIVSFASIAGAEMAAVGANAVSGTPIQSTGSMPETNLTLSQETSSIEEGKALYENGQLIAALGKFMTVLRKDPRNTEARQYLRMIVDTMRQNPNLSSTKLGTQEQAFATNPVVQEEVRRMLQLRSRLTLDLRAIPGVRVEIKGNANQVWIETPLLFSQDSRGLKEQGVPILDRVAAWLKTYGQQPVIIHCYPEELQEPTTNGSLFLHRYSELFHFFSDEKKLPAQRFVSADLLKPSEDAKKRGSEEELEELAISTSAARVVIETIGSQTALLDMMPSVTSTKGMSQWLENSITLNRKAFNPEEGEWVNLDLAALTRSGLRNWTFAIAPSEGKSPKPVFSMEGKTNLLMRLGWDGHDQQTGSFVRAGNYIAKLTATNKDGTTKSLEEMVQVIRTTKEAPVAQAPKPKAKPAKKPKSKPVQVVEAPVASSSPAVAAPDAKVDDSDSLIGDGTPAPDTSDAGHTIWKQVIQFEPNQSELMPTVKSSLERIGKTLEVYPLQKVRITGFAMVSEDNAAELAKARALAVQSILINEYHVDKKRVIVAGDKTSTEENASKVEMSITN